MLHPHTQLRYVSDEIGYGVFATQPILQGTIVYIKDSLELEILPEDYARHSPAMQQQIEKYSYLDERGIRVISWDFAKYVNHCCNCNTLSTAYGFDVTLRNIEVGEEITCDYGSLNVTKEMPLLCNKTNCRGRLVPADFETYYPFWDEKIKLALFGFTKVEQPLIDFIAPEHLNALHAFLEGTATYRSIYALRYHSMVGSPT